MHKIVMWIGAITAVVGLLVCILAFITMPTGAAMLTAFMFGVGSILSGAVLYCFGAIVEHLLAIRRATEAQLQFFTDRMKTRPAGN